ncbi:putative Cytochrome b561 [Hypsibius exemplaris]|uniref:Cytochrome b561 n=1 Tax=Hypsibius exemplaris TaxID=2072580 RepID=A0A1W0WKV1_HYPEX|nr:putative Cytochrome b561 [Hypsibius exemplaris]
MARSRFSNNGDPVVSTSQRVDVRVRGSSRNGDGEGPATATNTKHLIWYSALHIFLALLAVIMLSAFLVRKKGGFSWKNPDWLQGTFNFHPLFMVMSFMLLSGVGDILYRMCRSSPNKFAVKLAHATIQLAAFSFIVVAMCAAFWYHDMQGVPHLQSAHSWIGLVIVLLVSLQWLVGFCGLLFPGFRPPLRASYVLTHKFVGRCIYLLSLGNILIGINKISAGATIMNVTALVVLLYALNGGYILAKNAFAREAVDQGDGVTVFERRISVHESQGGANRYINISTAGTGGQYQSMGEDSIVKEAMAVGRDTFNRFHERLEKKKTLDVPGEFVTHPPTTTVTD